jgi:glycine/D-amino acid oxidase-like deaminating enzyme
VQPLLGEALNDLCQKYALIATSLWTPSGRRIFVGDGHVDPASCCNALAKGARNFGAKIEREAHRAKVMERMKAHSVAELVKLAAVCDGLEL